MLEEKGEMKNELREMEKKGEERIGENKNENGGILSKEIKMKDLRKYEVNVKEKGEIEEK